MSRSNRTDKFQQMTELELSTDLPVTGEKFGQSDTATATLSALEQLATVIRRPK